MNLNLKRMEKREYRSQTSPKNCGGEIQVQTALSSPGSNYRGAVVDLRSSTRSMGKRLDDAQDFLEKLRKCGNKGLATTDFGD